LRRALNWFTEIPLEIHPYFNKGEDLRAVAEMGW